MYTNIKIYTLTQTLTLTYTNTYTYTHTYTYTYIYIYTYTYSHTYTYTYTHTHTHTRTCTHIHPRTRTHTQLLPSVPRSATNLYISCCGGINFFNLDFSCCEGINNIISVNVVTHQLEHQLDDARPQRLFLLLRHDFAKIHQPLRHPLDGWIFIGGSMNSWREK